MRIKKKNILDFFLVIIIFAFTGSTTLVISAYVMDWLGFEKWSFAYILGYIFIIFPIYHILLLVYAFIFGRYTYFINRQKMILKKITGLFSKKDKEAINK
jgi:hypothetical protein